MGVGSSQPGGVSLRRSLPHFRKELRSGAAEGKDKTEKMDSLLQRQGENWATEEY